MKRFLNKLDDYEISLVSNELYRYELNSAATPSENEIFIGKVDPDIKGLFIYKSGQIFCLSYDDFSHDFLTDENTRLNDAYDNLNANITTLGAVSIMPDEDGGA